MSGGVVVVVVVRGAVRPGQCFRARSQQDVPF
jgi:hypothetical protein